MVERDGAATINYPAWTEYRKKNGLDPLGMQNSSVGLYQTLVPGVSNVTGASAAVIANNCLNRITP